MDTTASTRTFGATILNGVSGRVAALRRDVKALAAIGAGVAGGMTYVVGNAAAEVFACTVPATFALASLDPTLLV